MNRSNLVSFESYGWHKGFYNDKDFVNSLLEIAYTDFFENKVDDEDFPYSSALDFLFGSCHIFALSLQNLFGYRPYIVEGYTQKGFHAFCQVYKNQKHYYIDARGITTSFDEFMTVAKKFVEDEFVIRPIDVSDIAEWKKESYYDEAFTFAGEIIKKYRECFIL